MYRRTHGSGSHLVVGVHGWGGDHHAFDPLLPLVPPSVTLMAVDLPGFGQSSPPSVWDVDHVGTMLADTINAHSADEVTLVTSCAGAYPALSALPVLRWRLRRVVLVDPFAYAPWYFRVFTDHAWSPRAYALTFGSAWGRRLLGAGFALRRAEDGGLGHSFDTVRADHALAWLRACVAVGDVRRYASLRVPTTLAWGAGTFRAVRRSIPMWQALWPHAELRCLTGVGHLGIQEAPRVIAELAFDSGIPPAKTADTAEAA